MGRGCYDEFTDTNGTGLDSHASSYGAWDYNGSNFEVQSNKAQLSSATVNVPYESMKNCPGIRGHAQVVVDVDVVEDTHGIGVIASMDSGLANGWLLWMYTPGNTFSIFERASSSWVQRTSASVTIDAGDQFTATVDVNERTGYITATIAGDVNYSDNYSGYTHQGDYHGLRMQRYGTPAAYCTFDNFKAETVDNAAALMALL